MDSFAMPTLLVIHSSTHLFVLLIYLQFMISSWFSSFFCSDIRSTQMKRKEEWPRWKALCHAFTSLPACPSQARLSLLVNREMQKTKHGSASLGHVVKSPLAFLRVRWRGNISGAWVLHFPAGCPRKLLNVDGLPSPEPVE